MAADRRRLKQTDEPVEKSKTMAIKDKQSIVIRFGNPSTDNWAFPATLLDKLDGRTYVLVEETPGVPPSENKELWPEVSGDRVIWREDEEGIEPVAVVKEGLEGDRQVLSWVAEKVRGHSRAHVVTETKSPAPSTHRPSGMRRDINDVNWRPWLVGALLVALLGANGYIAAATIHQASQSRRDAQQIHQLQSDLATAQKSIVTLATVAGRDVLLQQRVTNLERQINGLLPQVVSVNINGLSSRVDALENSVRGLTDCVNRLVFDLEQNYTTILPTC